MKQNNCKKGLRSNKGIALIALVGIVVLILAIAYMTIFWAFNGGNSLNGGELADNLDEATKKAIQVEKIRNLGMDARIVSAITEEDVPIPDGFSYEQGNINTGLIIKSIQTGANYLYVPYNENSDTDTTEYFKKVKNYSSMDLMTLSSMEKYGGFFVALNSSYTIDDLKTIDQDNYKFLRNQLCLIPDVRISTKAHLLYKEEINLINHYLKTEKIKLGDNKIGIQAFVIEPFSKINPEELVADVMSDNKVLGNAKNQNIKISKVSNTKLTKVAETSITKNNSKNMVYMLGTHSALYGGTNTIEAKVPIPYGFNYLDTTQMRDNKVTKNGSILIQDKSNTNLIYVWVPLQVELDIKDGKNNKDQVSDYVDSVKDEIWKSLYLKYNKNMATDFKDIITESVEEYDSNFIESINKWKGFYISQAELSRNKAR